MTSEPHLTKISILDMEFSNEYFMESQKKTEANPF